MPAGEAHARHERPGIFISYRRADSAGYAGRLHDSLVTALGHRVRLFMDVDSIDPGIDFGDALDDAVAKCRLFLAVIGPNFVDIKGDDGRPRLDDENDFVRREIATALSAASVRVVPVLVGGAKLPTAESLPEDLRPLVRRQAFELSPTRWQHDVDALVTHSLNARPPARGARIGIAAIVAALLIAAAGIVFSVAGHHDKGRAAGSPASATSRTSPVTTTIPSPSSAAGAPAQPLDRLVWHDPMTDAATGWRTYDAPTCGAAIGPDGYRVVVKVQHLSCSDEASFMLEASKLGDARVEADASVVSFTGDDPSLELECRTNGHDADFTGYAAELETGQIAFYRYESAQSLQTLAAGDVDGVRLRPGAVHHMTLDCYQSGAKVDLALSLDGRFLGSATDSKPLPAGSVGVACGTGALTTATCRFSQFEVFGPSSGADDVGSVQDLASRIHDTRLACTTLDAESSTRYTGSVAAAECNDSVTARANNTLSAGGALFVVYQSDSARARSEAAGEPFQCSSGTEPLLEVTYVVGANWIITGPGDSPDLERSFADALGGGARVKTYSCF